MSDIKLDLTTGDIDISSNRVLLIDNSVDALQQRLTIRLKTFKEEWFLNRNAGLPYFQEIFKKETPKDLVDSIFRSFILKTSGVSRLVNFSSVKDNSARTYTLNFTVITPDQQALNIIDFEV